LPPPRSPRPARDAPHDPGQRRHRDSPLQRVRGGGPLRPGPPERRDSDHHGAVTLLLLIAALQADSASFAIRDFPFASGETLPVLRLHYLTLGRLRRDAGGSARNAVLILHGTGGSGSQFLSPLFAGELYGPGQPLDTTTHYLILPDNLGHGRSSKPSDGLKARFPHYTYGDMVAAQYRLVTDGLHVDHLLLVMGTSMGCMHSWLWAERHPDFLDGVVPLACAPTQIAGRNRMMRHLIIENIRGDPDWRGGTYSQQPRGLLAALQILFMMSSSPLQLQRIAPTRDSADAYITRWLRERLAGPDANDMASQFEAACAYSQHPRMLLAALQIFFMMSSSPLQRQRIEPTRDSADAYITRWLRERLAGADANDMAYQFEASRDYDPSPDLERVTVPVLAINSADDLINPPELGIMERLMPRVKQGRFVLIPTSDITRGHGTHTVAAAWKQYFAP